MWLAYERWFLSTPNDKRTQKLTHFKMAENVTYC